MNKIRGITTKLSKERWGKAAILILAIAIIAMCIFVMDQAKKQALRAIERKYGIPPETPCPKFRCTPDPNSRRIAFSSDRFDRNHEIYVMNADGTCVTRLTNFPSWRGRKDAAQPAWSPDGTRILFEFDGSYPEIDLYVVTADGAHVKLLTKGGRNCDAKWSPDGSKIAFKSDRDGRPALYVMDSDGSNERRLADAYTLECERWFWDSRAWHYDWSPDGEQIVFTGIDPVEDQRDVYVANIANGELTNLTNHPAKDTAVVWVPRENKVLFHSDRLADETGIPTLLTLYMMDPDGANLQRIVDLPPFYENAPDERSVRGWVPTATLQLVLSGHDSYGELVYILDVACALENSPEPGMMPQECYHKFGKLWSLDGIYWSSGDPKLTLMQGDGRGSVIVNEILVADYTGKNITNLTRCSADDQDPAWSP